MKFLYNVSLPVLQSGYFYVFNDDETFQVWGKVYPAYEKYCIVIETDKLCNMRFKRQKIVARIGLREGHNLINSYVGSFKIIHYIPFHIKDSVLMR